MISAIPNATWTVVISRGQSRNPKKRELEQAIADAAERLDGVSVLVIPHLYDLPKASESFQQLSEIEGNLVVISWIYSRAAHWVLDRNGIQGQIGVVQIGGEESTEDDENSPAAVSTDRDPVDRDPVDGDPVDGDSVDGDSIDRVTDLYPRPDRCVHCIDLKIASDPSVFVNEIRRIVGDDDTDGGTSLPIISGAVRTVDEATSRRWYPVIDFDRCTNCMECVDFCLFGVYGVDGVESILVEQPDNCRKGCPACSRVCPENAIIFPQHKAPAIAGAEIEGDEGFKIDLSQLFGAPAQSDDPIATAARERDEQLLLAGRDAVGIDEQLKKRQSDRGSQPKDQLDVLIDSLDQFDL